MKRKQKIEESDNYLTISERCNLNCVFCSAKNRNIKQSDNEVMESIKLADDVLQVGGWEPTLSKDVVRWVKDAKKRGVKSIILRTNAVLLAQNVDLIRKLVDAGVDQFNVNFPSHISKVCDFITQTKGSYNKKVKALNNLIEIAGGDKVRVTFVINKLNYTTMPSYVRFIAKHFPSILCMGFNIVHVEGQVENRKYLVPKLSDISPYLIKAAQFCKKRDMLMVVDDVPLCFMNGFETLAIYVWTLPNGDKSYLPHAKHRKSCMSCKLSGICPGLDNAYFKIYGAKELKASDKSAEVILEEIRRRRTGAKTEKNKPIKLAV
ncbi:MAG: radical SAM protein [Elusimicrobia bacterium]|nr:radical SAM protein [Elusimicrobiota bacterium]